MERSEQPKRRLYMTATKLLKSVFLPNFNAINNLWSVVTYGLLFYCQQ